MGKLSNKITSESPADENPKAGNQFSIIHPVKSYNYSNPDNTWAHVQYKMVTSYVIKNKTKKNNDPT